MAITLWKVICAVQALIVTILMISGLCFGQVITMLLRRFPRKFFPKSIQEEIFDKGFSPNVTHKTFLETVRMQYPHFYCPIKVGGKAPNINIITLEKVTKKLLDCAREGRPLVVNFGSCS